MPTDTELLKHLYDRFNARDMEAVLATMHRDVVWANGWEGGYVHVRSQPASRSARMERRRSRST
jgi:ketosteroid isomerase-like protein